MFFALKRIRDILNIHIHANSQGRRVLINASINKRIIEIGRTVKKNSRNASGMLMKKVLKNID